MKRLLALLVVILAGACTNVAPPASPTQPPQTASAPPTATPSTAPTASPTAAPTASPSPSPTLAATPEPTATGAASPSAEPTRTPISSPIAGTPLEQLMAHIPADFRQECHEITSFDAGFVVGVSCTPDAIDGYITYYQFDTLDNVNASYQSNLDFFGEEATGTSCQTEASAGRYTIGGVEAGSLFCAPYDGGLISEWTHEDFLITASMVLYAEDYAAFWSAWQVAGPDPVAGEATPAPQQTPVAATWTTNATLQRGLVGQQFDFVCPPAGAAQTIWGTDIYTDDSSVCTAGVHVGVIDLATGGTVTIEMRGGETSYAGTTRNGVTSLNYGSWSSSFIIVTP